MKNLLGAFALMLVVGLTSCGGSECVECSITDPFFGLEVTTEACEDGDNLIVTSTALGITQDTTIIGQSVADFRAEAIAEGFTCN